VVALQTLIESGIHGRHRAERGCAGGTRARTCASGQREREHEDGPMIHQ
jgi:hypothetical protein